MQIACLIVTKSMKRPKPTTWTHSLALCICKLCKWTSNKIKWTNKLWSCIFFLLFWTHYYRYRAAFRMQNGENFLGELCHRTQPQQQKKHLINWFCLNFNTLVSKYSRFLSFTQKWSVIYKMFLGNQWLLLKIIWWICWKKNCYQNHWIESFI